MFALFHPLGIGPVGQAAPATLSVGFLAKLWWARELYGVQLTAFAAWFVAALAIQLASRGPWSWIAGYVGQVALAVGLVLKDQADNIF